MPELFNQTAFAVELTPLIDKDGRNVFAVIAKATFELGAEGTLTPAAAQEPVALVDRFVGGDSSAGPVSVPSDLADYKPATDVIVIPPADFPEQNRYDGKEIGIEVSSVRKFTRVRRTWPFGALRRDQSERRRFAGTYDQAWQENRMPLLPADFDPRFNQAAPADQVVRGYLDGDEQVTVVDLFRTGRVSFHLPGRALGVAGNVLQRYFTAVAHLDTLLIWLDPARVSLVWRHAIPCRRKPEEVGNVFVYSVGLRTARELFGAP